MQPTPALNNLYRRPIQATRRGPLYNAFSYPTKIDPEAVAVFIAAHTQPGETVLDPFGGSGSAGIGAALCDRPTDRMRSIAAKAGIEPRWGPRNAVIYELSPLGAMIAQVMANPPDPVAFSDAATRLIEETAARLACMYEADSPAGKPGTLRYIIWSEILQTPCCGHVLTLWDAAVRLDPVILEKAFDCPACGLMVDTASCERLVSRSVDPFTEEAVEQRQWQAVRIYGESGGATWSRPPTAEDLDRIEQVRTSPVEGQIPTEPILWGDLFRSGYHTGISRFHHLYTPRNLRAIAALWAGVERHSGAIADALRLLVLSYNASHSTLMTRVVVKREQKDFVITGAQSGVLYVSGLPVEKNVFSGLRRKIKTFAGAFALTYGSKSDVTVVNASSTRLRLLDGSVDYVFTDPPFGGFIPYAEVNQVNEAWLGGLTDRTEEAIVSPAQGKGISEYAHLMERVFAEVGRVLRPDGKATVVFHASKPEVWQAVGDAFRTNDFAVERTSILDKTQVSFKQVVHDGGTRGDAIFLLRRGSKTDPSGCPNVDEDALDAVLKVAQQRAAQDPAELKPRRIYSRYVAYCLERGLRVVHSAPEFYAQLDSKLESVASRTS